MIKVLHVVSDMNIGGAGKVVINLINAMPGDEALIKAVVPAGSKLADAITGAEVIECAGIADKSLSVAGIAALIRLLRAERPDIVHAHAGLSARIAARITGARVVFTRHWKGNTRVSAFGRLMNNYLCDMAFAVSEVARDSLVATGVRREKIRLIYNGVEPLKRDISKRLLKELGISGGIVIGVAARLEPVKNHAVLLDAAAIALRQRDDTVLLIAGEGSLEAGLKAHAEGLGIADRVRFLGFVRDMSAFMSALDIHVVSSLEEAFPTTVLEAASIGVPTVATDCGGTAEQIKSGVSGLLVRVNDSEALAEGILRLADDAGLRTAMGEAALADYRGKFGAVRFAAETLEAYRQLTGHEGRRNL